MTLTMKYADELVSNLLWVGYDIYVCLL